MKHEMSLQGLPLLPDPAAAPMSISAPICDDALLRAALDHAPIGLIVLDADRVVRHVCPVSAALLGIETGDIGTGLTASELVVICRTLDSVSRQQFGTILHDASDDEPSMVLLSLRYPDGMRKITVDVRRAGLQGWVVSLDDVTESRQSQDWLLEHVSSDPVTGLWNRQHFMLMLKDSLAVQAEAVRTQGGSATLYVVLLNLQRFRLVNETLGTAAGDLVLRMMGTRIASALQEDDMLARFAADEFAVAVCRPGGEDAVNKLCAILVERLSYPYLIEGQSISFGVHAGIVHTPNPCTDADALVGKAGLALQAAAGEPAGFVRLFDASLTERAVQRRALEADLRVALQRREFVLHYQPQVDVHRNCVTGLEALIRWHHPTRGLVPPSDFIPLAEQLGLIVDIGDWVLLDACREASTWPEEVTVAVNASPLQFETGRFAQSVAAALEATGLAASRLEIEVTESLLLRDTGAVLGTLDALQHMGVRLVLDDFGTGYASLSQLSRFRFDKIKIDRSFVSPADPAMEHGAIVRSIAALGRSLGIPTTAEGVETQGQLDQITNDGCTCVQGYYLSRPVPAGDVGQVLARLHHPERCVAA